MAMEQRCSTNCKTEIRKSRLFAGLPDETLDRMLAHCRQDTWRRGVHLDDSLFQRRFYLITQGRLEVMRSNPETGRNITLALMGPGDGVDVITLLNGQPHEVESVAVDDVSLVSVPLQDARNWIRDYPEFNRNFLPYLGDQMRLMEDLATDLALHDTMTRMARLILRHILPHHEADNSSPPALKLINDLHDESLARMIGSVRQVVNRHLQHWRRQGVLHDDRFKTVIRDLKLLRDYATGVVHKTGKVSGSNQ